MSLLYGNTPDTDTARNTNDNSINIVYCSGYCYVSAMLSDNWVIIVLSVYVYHRYKERIFLYIDDVYMCSVIICVFIYIEYILLIIYYYINLNLK